MSATLDPTLFLDYFRHPTEQGVGLRADSFDVEGSGFSVQTHYLPDILAELSQTGELHTTMQTLLQGKKSKISSSAYIKNEMHFSARVKASAAGRPAAITEVGGDRAVSPTPAAVEPPSPDEADDEVHTGLVTAVVAHISQNAPAGDVLVFLPGKGVIDAVHDLLVEFRPLGINFADETKFRLYKLHSTLRETNDEVFEEVPPGCRRIILATNIAETSLTLPDVVYVVDTGKVRNSLFDPVSLRRSLPYGWISKTSSIQRRGRAGRVRDGHYYALFSEERYDTFSSMARPKITMSDLVDTVLQLKAHPQTGGVDGFLRETVDPPSPEAIDRAIHDLQSLDALDKDQNITKLGRLLCQFSLRAAHGKAIFLGALFGCLEPMMILACHNFENPLVFSAELSIRALTETKRRYNDGDHESDIALLVDTFREYHAAYQAGDEDRMSELRESRSIRHTSYLEMMLTSRAIHAVLADYGLLPQKLPRGQSVFEILPDVLNSASHNVNLVRALALNTVGAEIAAWSATKKRWSVDTLACVGFTSRSSINYTNRRSSRRIERKYRADGRLMAYAWKRNMDNSDCDEVWLEHTSMVTPLLAVLFGRRTTLQSPTVVGVNGWLQLQLQVDDTSSSSSSVLASQPARILFETRKAIDRFVARACNMLKSRLLESPKLPGPLSLMSTTQSWKMFSSVEKGLSSSDSLHWNSLATFLHSPLRQEFVAQVVKMLDEDQAFWTAYRRKRRAEIETQEAELAEQQKLFMSGLLDEEDEVQGDEAQDDEVQDDIPPEDLDHSFSPSPSPSPFEESDTPQLDQEAA
jgi:HrpA-like RNA helicase